MQICIARMIRESGIFFVLLAIVGAGFAQSLYAIDAADGHTESGSLIVNNLVQGLLGSPNFGYSENSWWLLIYYLWNVFTTIILLNILISLFSTAYNDITDDAAAQFLAFFSGKTVAMIRAPDEFVYPAPFNLVEIFFVAPFEWFISKKAYARYNRVVMSILFAVPLAVIALLESQLDVRTSRFMKSVFEENIDEGEEDDPNNQNPPTDHENGMQISKVPFDELIRPFPNSYQSMESSILAEIRALHDRIDELAKQLGANKKEKE